VQYCPGWWEPLFLLFCGYLRAVAENVVCRAWFFDGGIVVERVIKMVVRDHEAPRRKFSSFSHFIFGWTNSLFAD
jgi:hypothetical protein